jgi:hypothetical protein
MKFINIIFLLPLAAFANPIAEPIPEASAMALASPEPETSPNPSQESHLLVARDNVCHIITAGVSHHSTLIFRHKLIPTSRKVVIGTRTMANEGH